MKKVTLLVSTRERTKAVNALRRLGVLHVQALRPPTSEEVYRLQAELSNAEKAAFLLADYKVEKAQGDAPKDLVDQVISLVQRRDALTAELTEKRDAYR
ncbi:MAG: hypothetical protein ONB12_03740, partial [candidate division KSB1 bacterium]|nr:hypothetical protein [candidate division KSB1 bacterium]